MSRDSKLPALESKALNIERQVEPVRRRLGPSVHYSCYFDRLARRDCRIVIESLHTIRVAVISLQCRQRRAAGKESKYQDQRRQPRGLSE